jgi:soluble lytic murein transglycosylase-like protein
MRRQRTTLIIAALVGGFLLLRSRPVWSIPIEGARFFELFEATENKYNIPRNLLARVAYQESRFREDIINGDVVSSAGAEGIMQIVPRWHPNVNPYNIPEAIDYAGSYLAKLYDTFGNWQLALAAYNFGQGNVRKWLAGEKQLPTETKNYVDQISQDIYL